MEKEIIKLSQIQVNDSNPRIISDEKFKKLVDSILVLPKMLELRPIVVDESMTALGGNMRYRALTDISTMSEEQVNQRLCAIHGFLHKEDAEKEALRTYWREWLKNPTAQIIRADELTEEEQREFIIKDNVGFGEWDYDMLANEWDSAELDEWGVDVWQDTADTGGEDNQEDSQASNEGDDNNSLVERFVVPPFSVIDTRKGYWQNRKKMWRNIIGDLGESRENKLATSELMKYKDLYSKSYKERQKLGISFKEYLANYVSEEVLAKENSKPMACGVSLFDPVLAEILCKWFTPHKGAKIFDCFAGDTQKGLVFAQSGYSFTGVELRQEQVDVNNKVIENRGLDIRYICDDGQNVANYFEPQSQDMLFSCPPYYDLEKYSTLPNDASNQESYEDFVGVLRNAFVNALSCLKDNRFVVIVVGDVRDKTGCYYDLCSDVKQIFKENGAPLYNEIILIESGASAAIRAGKCMETRKVVKTHQNILIFYKGDTSLIRSNFKPLELTSDEQAIFEEQCKEFEEYNELELDSENGNADVQDDYNSTENLLMKELNKFREPFMKEKLISYVPYPQLKQAIKDGDIYIERNSETGKIDGYLWLENLKRKPLSRIYEICSARKGLGRKLIEMAIEKKAHPTLQLWVVDYNENAISFYKHMGFVEIERETGKKINNLTMEYKG